MFGFRNRSKSIQKQPAKTVAPSVSAPPTPPPPPPQFPPHDHDDSDNSSEDMSLYTTQSKATVRYPPRLLNYRPTTVDLDDFYPPDDDYSLPPTEYTSELVMHRHALLGGSSAGNKAPALGVASQPTQKAPLTPRTDTESSSPVEGDDDDDDDDDEDDDDCPTMQSSADTSDEDEQTSYSLLPATAKMAQRFALLQPTSLPPKEKPAPLLAPKIDRPDVLKKRKESYTGPVDLDESLPDTASLQSSAHSAFSVYEGQIGPNPIISQMDLVVSFEAQVLPPDDDDSLGEEVKMADDPAIDAEPEPVLADSEDESEPEPDLPETKEEESDDDDSLYFKQDVVVESKVQELIPLEQASDELAVLIPPPEVQQEIPKPKVKEQAQAVAPKEALGEVSNTPDAFGSKKLRLKSLNGRSRGHPWEPSKKSHSLNPSTRRALATWMDDMALGGPKSSPVASAMVSKRFDGKGMQTLQQQWDKEAYGYSVGSTPGLFQSRSFEHTSPSSFQDVTDTPTGSVPKASKPVAKADTSEQTPPATAQVVPEAKAVVSTPKAEVNVEKTSAVKQIAPSQTVSKATPIATPKVEGSVASVGPSNVVTLVTAGTNSAAPSTPVAVQTDSKSLYESLTRGKVSLPESELQKKVFETTDDGFRDDDTYGFTVASGTENNFSATNSQDVDALRRQWDENSYGYSVGASVVAKNYRDQCDLSTTCSSVQEIADVSSSYAKPQVGGRDLTQSAPEPDTEDSIRDDDTYGFTIASGAEHQFAADAADEQDLDALQRQWDENTYGYSVGTSVMAKHHGDQFDLSTTCSSVQETPEIFSHPGKPQIAKNNDNRSDATHSQKIRNQGESKKMSAPTEPTLDATDNDSTSSEGRREYERLASGMVPMSSSDLRDRALEKPEEKEDFSRDDDTFGFTVTSAIVGDSPTKQFTGQEVSDLQRQWDEDTYGYSVGTSVLSKSRAVQQHSFGGNFSVQSSIKSVNVTLQKRSTPSPSTRTSAFVPPPVVGDDDGVHSVMSALSSVAEPKPQLAVGSRNGRVENEWLRNGSISSGQPKHNISSQNQKGHNREFRDDDTYGFTVASATPQSVNSRELHALRQQWDENTYGYSVGASVLPGKQPSKDAHFRSAPTMPNLSYNPKKTLSPKSPTKPSQLPPMREPMFVPPPVVGADDGEHTILSALTSAVIDGESYYGESQVGHTGSQKRVAALTEPQLQRHMVDMRGISPQHFSSLEDYNKWKQQQEHWHQYFEKVNVKHADTKPPVKQKIVSTPERKQPVKTNSQVKGDRSVGSFDSGTSKSRKSDSGSRRWRLFGRGSGQKFEEVSPKGRKAANHMKSKQPQVVSLDQFMKINAEQQARNIGAFQPSVAPEFTTKTNEPPTTAAVNTLSASDSQVPNTNLPKKKHGLKQEQVELEHERIQKRKEEAVMQQRRLNLGNVSPPRPTPRTEEKRSSSDVGTMCVMCHSSARSHLAMPCMHFHFCGSCVSKLQREGCRTCPSCAVGNVTFAQVHVA